MWKILFAQSVLCFYSAGMCWATDNPELGPPGFSFAAIGILSAANAAYLRRKLQSP
jgi:hypothetical protein